MNDNSVIDNLLQCIIVSKHLYKIAEYFLHHNNIKSGIENDIKIKNPFKIAELFFASCHIRYGNCHQNFRKLSQVTKMSLIEYYDKLNFILHYTFLLLRKFY